MRRIVLEQKPRRPQLPVYSEIDQTEIREAAAAWDAAKADADEAKKTLVQLEQELPNAHLEDARADERLRAEGKAKLKGRPATQAAEKGIADAEHEQRVSELTEQRTFDELQAAIDEHGDAWAESVEHDLEALNSQWADAVSALQQLHAQRTATMAIAAMVVGDQAGAGALSFEPSQIRGIEFAQGAGRQTGHVTTGDVLASLAALGQPASPPPEPVQHPPLRPMFVPDAGQEQAERREFLERANSPERVEERRQRADQRRQANADALAESLSSE